LAYTYFERLTVLKIVEKENRKTLASACLMLSFKFNEIVIKNKKPLKRLCQAIERVFGVRKKDIVHVEFALFALLSFNLGCTPDQIMPHFNQMVQSLDIVPHEYLFI